jgi:hypothetical protein
MRLGEEGQSGLLAPLGMTVFGGGGENKKRGRAAAGPYISCAQSIHPSV